MKNRTARIAAMEAELRARGATLSMGDDLDDELREAVLHDILVFENSLPTTLRTHFGGNPPRDLPTLVARLAELNIVLENTDHLDDEALMKELDAYLDESVVIPHDPGTIMHVDLIGTGSEEDIASWLPVLRDRAGSRRLGAAVPGLRPATTREAALRSRPLAAQGARGTRAGALSGAEVERKRGRQRRRSRARSQPHGPFRRFDRRRPTFVHRQSGAGLAQNPGDTEGNRNDAAQLRISSA